MPSPTVSDLPIPTICIVRSKLAFSLVRKKSQRRSCIVAATTLHKSLSNAQWKIGSLRQSYEDHVIHINQTHFLALKSYGLPIYLKLDDDKRYSNNT
jgi:hypothetical protein